jgi:two-component system, NtrC family, response regulator HupR/HoxA
MSRRLHIPWDDVLDLRVVRSLAGLLDRRFKLGLSFRTLAGTQPGAGSDIAQGPCGRLRERVCRNCLAEMGPQLADQPAAVTCPVGMRVLCAPIRVERDYLGLVAGGAYLAADNGSTQPVDLALAGLGLPEAEREQVIAGVPILSASDELIAKDVIGSLAAEIALFQREAQGLDRRQAATERRTRYHYHEIIGESRPILELYHLLDKVIDSDSTVLVYGENGTGKELIARAIHFNSQRSGNRFVVQNCSAFNDNLLDSELFGHKKGAFTGAVSDKQGLFEVADGSTFFLDEIGDMSPSLQVKLLRVLQEGTFIPVGDTQSKHVDVRIIAATNRDLKRMVERGEFREDLYYRINVIAIHVPPLRDRREDIPLLIEHFLHKHVKGDRHRLKRLSKGCIARLTEYSWPGNIRELEIEIERLLVLAGSEEKVLAEDLLSSRILQRPGRPEAAPSRAGVCLPEAVESLERSMIYEVLKRNHWNKTRAAQELRISRRNLIRKVSKYQLDRRTR